MKNALCAIDVMQTDQHNAQQTSEGVGSRRKCAHLELSAGEFLRVVCLGHDAVRLLQLRRQLRRLLPAALQRRLQLGAHGAGGTLRLRAELAGLGDAQLRQLSAELLRALLRHPQRGAAGGRGGLVHALGLGALRLQLLHLLRQRPHARVERLRLARRVLGAPQLLLRHGGAFELACRAVRARLVTLALGCLERRLRRRNALVQRLRLGSRSRLSVSQSRLGGAVRPFQRSQALLLLLRTLQRCTETRFLLRATLLHLVGCSHGRSKLCFPLRAQLLQQCLLRMRLRAFVLPLSAALFELLGPRLRSREARFLRGATVLQRRRQRVRGREACLLLGAALLQLLHESAGRSEAGLLVGAALLQFCRHCLRSRQVRRLLGGVPQLLLGSCARGRQVGRQLRAALLQLLRDRVRGG